MVPYLQIIHCFPDVLEAPDLVCLHWFQGMRSGVQHLLVITALLCAHRALITWAKKPALDKAHQLALLSQDLCRRPIQSDVK